MVSKPNLSTMNGERPRHRFVSSLVAFIGATAPILGFYLGIIAGLEVTWWLGVDLLLGVFMGLLYSQRAYSLSRLWRFVWAVWKGLVLAYVATVLIFGLDFIAVRKLELVGRIFFGGLVFVVFSIVYGASYQSVYIESAQA